MNWFKQIIEKRLKPELVRDALRWLKPQRKSLILLAILQIVTLLATSAQTVPLIFLASLGRGAHVVPLFIIEMMSGYMALIITYIAGTYGTEILKSKIAYAVHTSMRQKMYNHLRKLPGQFFDEPENITAAVEIMKRLYKQSGLVTMLHRWWTNILGLIFTIITLWLIGWEFSLFGCLLVLSFSLLLTKPIQRRRKATHQRVTSEARLSEYMAALLSPDGWLFTIITDSEHAIGERFQILNEENRKDNLEEDTNRRWFILLYQVLSNFSLASPYLVIGCQLYFWHILSWGLPLLLAVASQFNRILMYCNALIDIPKEEMEVPLQLRALSAFLKRPVQQDVRSGPRPPQPDPRGDIVFNNVSFSYYKDGQDIPILKNFNLTIKGEQALGIVGPTGTGKTTLVKLLLRLYEVESGNITIGGVDIRDIPLKILRGWFGYCLQDPRMLPFTIKENLSLARPGVTLEEIKEAAKRARIHDTITRMQKGYDTPYRSGSGGEKQRLGIALALLRGPISVFDEFTASLDAFTEWEIIQAVKQATAGHTRIIIGHRLTTIANLADRPNDLIVVVGPNGIIQEQGTHRELMEKRAYYFSLWKTQIGGVDLSELYKN